MAIYRIVYAPTPNFRPSVVNASSETEAARLFGAGLPEWGKALVVVREVPADDERRIAVGRRVAA